MAMLAYYFPLSDAESALILSGKTNIEEFIDQRRLAEGERFDFDKAWHGIHFLLNQDPWEGEGPLFDLVLGGQELHEGDFGCGPARYLSAECVKACARAAATVDFESLRSSYDWRSFLKKGIYPLFDHDEFDYLAYYFSLLSEFFTEASESDAGLLLFIG